jgi:Ni/Fe-hydrogenase 1 B-type cytochrome subunit
MTAGTVERVRAPAPAERPMRATLVRLYVWQLPVRLAHWTIALSVFTLAFTGFYLGHPFLVVPGQARFHFVTGTMRAIHLWAAIVFTSALVMRLFWMFAGNRWASWRTFVPTTARRWRNFFGMFRYYTFTGPPPPLEIGHNALAGAAYLAVYGLCAIQVLTGVAIWSATVGVGSPLHALAPLATWLGGLALVRWVHHLCMWLLLGFFAHHIWSALLFSISRGTGTLESIFSGYKFVPPADVERERSGARE